VGGEMGRCSKRSYGLAEEYKKCAELTGCRFFDGSAITLNTIDYMHLDENGHKCLAEQICRMVQ
jgi:hypothetical protein